MFNVKRLKEINEYHGRSFYWLEFYSCIFTANFSSTVFILRSTSLILGTAPITIASFFPAGFSSTPHSVSLFRQPGWCWFQMIWNWQRPESPCKREFPPLRFPAGSASLRVQATFHECCWPWLSASGCHGKYFWGPDHGCICGSGKSWRRSFQSTSEDQMSPCRSEDVRNVPKPALNKILPRTGG